MIFPLFIVLYPNTNFGPTKAYSHHRLSPYHKLSYLSRCPLSQAVPYYTLSPITRCSLLHAVPLSQAVPYYTLPLSQAVPYYILPLSQAVTLITCHHPYKNSPLLQAVALSRAIFPTTSSPKSQTDPYQLSPLSQFVPYHRLPPLSQAVTLITSSHAYSQAEPILDVTNVTCCLAITNCSPITGIAVHLLPTFTLITSCHLFHKLSPYHKLYLLRCRPYHNCPLSQAVHYHKPSPLTQAVPLSQALPLEHTVTPIKAVTLIICPLSQSIPSVIS